jgi:hypothetical protein
VGAACFALVVIIFDVMADKRELKRIPNVDAVGWPEDEFSADLGHGQEAVAAADSTAFTRPLSHHEGSRVREKLGKAADAVTVLQSGTSLQQGSTYLDLDNLDAGPFVGRAGQKVHEGRLIAAKRDLDHELWNVLVGGPADRRPGESEDDG